MNLSDTPRKGIQRDPTVIADSLMQLTSGWTPGQGVAKEVLTTARAALASSLAAGRTPAEIHASAPALRRREGAQSKVEREFLRIASDVVSAKPEPSVAIIRSPYVATVDSPDGRPAWAHGARIGQSYGPFFDNSGFSHWVDVIPLTSSKQFAFGNPAIPFGVFPVIKMNLMPLSLKKITLGQGSVWFLANLLASALPNGAFTGFSISGGTAESSEGMTVKNGIYIIPATATLTVRVKLAAASKPAGTGSPGADAAAAVFTPPSEVILKFKQLNAVFETISSANASVFGSSVTLEWNSGTIGVEAVAALPEILVRSTVSPSVFTFSDVDSKIFTPSGSASIDRAGWALPLIKTGITTLPSAAGPGAALLRLSAGALLKTSMQPVTDMSRWIIEVMTGRLYIFTTGKSRSVRTTFQLWPEPVTPARNSTTDFLTLKDLAYGYLAFPGSEFLVTPGMVEPHLDRPKTATGKLFAYKGGAILLLILTSSGTGLSILGFRKVDKQEIIPIALENALIGVDTPAIFGLAGTLHGDQILPCHAGFFFGLRWILPTLPDPYASNFDMLSGDGESGRVTAITSWKAKDIRPNLKFAMQSEAQNIKPVAIIREGLVAARTESAPFPVLLDLSTRVDLLGVTLNPRIAMEMKEMGLIPGGNNPPGTASPISLSGMSLALNSELIATFALPQFSWEPMESTAENQPGPLYCYPPSDGKPLLVSAPDVQQLVPFMPWPVLKANITNVRAGKSFYASFSLPFGLNAVIYQPNEVTEGKSGFLEKGGRFATNIPHFENSALTDDTVSPQAPNPAAPDNPVQPLTGALTLSLKPEDPTRSNAKFAGYTETDKTGGREPDPSIPDDEGKPGYGTIVLGYDNQSHSTDVGDIFDGQLGSGGTARCVPLRRIDLSGYGASTFSEWIDEESVSPNVTKVHFEASIGRTALDIIQVASVIYPYCIRVVRTITMQRQNAGWVKRTDSGWQAASTGEFKFPFNMKIHATDPNNYPERLHLGPLKGAFNIRNIRDDRAHPEKIPIKDPLNPTKRYMFRQVLFDADFMLNENLRVTSGGFSENGKNFVVSKNIVGFLQLAPTAADPPTETTPTPEILSLLFGKVDPLRPAISCTVEAGRIGNKSGTVFRCSALEVAMIEDSSGNSLTPAIGVALLGAPQIPRGGGWSMGRRRYNEPAPSALPQDSPVPLVRPMTISDVWYIADIADILQLDTPYSYYSMLHATGTQKILFESPQVPASAGVSSEPGLQFPQQAPPRAGGMANPGSPNLGDIAAILNSTGLFPGIDSTISIMSKSEVTQIKTGMSGPGDMGWEYEREFFFPMKPEVPIFDLDPLMQIMLAYRYKPKPPNQSSFTPTRVFYKVNSRESPSWSLKVQNFSILAVIPGISSVDKPLLTISGGFYADEHTPPGLTGLDVEFGPALELIKTIFSGLQTLAQFLPGGSIASLDVALSEGTLRVSQTFAIAEMPLGLGNLTDVSMNVGLDVRLMTGKASFIVSVGTPDHPFNWTATPLAGNGMILIGVKENKPTVDLQLGLGLGIGINLGIASGSASVVIAFRAGIEGNTVKVMIILTGRAEVDVLGGIASASLTLSAAVGANVTPIPLPPYVPEWKNGHLIIPELEIELIGVASVGVHISICWVVSVDWEGSWEFSQTITTPELAVTP